MAASDPQSVVVQYVCRKRGLPRPRLIRTWARAAFAGDAAMHAESVTVRFVEAAEARLLNRDFRGKDYATNVLSFAYQPPPDVCGDLVLCVPVIVREASELGKSVEAHCAHLIVHGLLHLQGYDHEDGGERAAAMEATERRILAHLGFPDPYDDAT